MWKVAAVVACWAFFVAVQLAGLDFGNQHPDEQGNLDQAAWSLHQRWPGPAYYFYPYGLFALINVMALPEILTRGLDGASAWLVEGGPDVLLRMRAVLVLLSSAIVPATWLLARRVRAGTVEALFATALVATSWQLGLHARFIATDALVAMLTTTAIAALASAYTQRRRALLFVAAALIGVGAGVKYYPMVLAIVGVGVCLSIEPRARAPRTLLASALVCLGAFVVTTPGAVLEPGLIVRALKVQREIYGAGWYGWTVDGPAGVVAALSQWFLFAALGKSMVLSSALAAVAVLGLVRMGREGPTRLVLTAAGVLVLPFLFQSTFVSRNMLPLIPILAIGAARGLSVVTTRAPSGLRAGLVVVVACFGALAAIGAAASIRHAARDPAMAFHDTARFVEEHPDEVFLASPSVRAALQGTSVGERVVAPDDPRVAQTTRVLAQPTELWVAWEMPANEPFLIAEMFGPDEIDFRYMTSWRGAPRVVLLEIARARDAGAALDFKPVAHSPGPAMPLHLLER